MDEQTPKPVLSEESSVQSTAVRVKKLTAPLSRKGFLQAALLGIPTFTGATEAFKRIVGPPPQAPAEAAATTEASAAKEVIPPGVVSSFPAGLDNDMAIVVNGVNLVTPESFGKYLFSRAQDLFKNPENLSRDIMFAQLTQRVKDLKDRGLNFQERNGGQGLGFIQKSLSVLRTEANITGTLLQDEADGYRRGWALVPARKLKATIEIYADAALKSMGKDPAVAQEERSALISRIMGDLGIKPVEKDGIEQPIGDYFATNVTYLNEAAVGEQKETVSSVEFAPNVEVADDDVRQETFARQDSRNTMLFTMVIGKDGHVRVEAFDLGNPQPDSLESTWATYNFQHEDAVEEGKTRRAHGGRLVPVGEVAEQPLEEEKSKKLDEQPSFQPEKPPPTEEPDKKTKPKITPEPTEKELKPGWGGPRGGHYGPPGHGYTEEDPGTKVIPPGQTDPRNPSQGRDQGGGGGKGGGKGKP